MICPKCNKKNIRTRIKTRDRVCNSCGNVWLIIHDQAEVPHEQKKFGDSKPTHDVGFSF